MIKAIWLHQFDRVQEHSWQGLLARWPGQYYVKALDGLDWMATFDADPRAVDGPAGSSGGHWGWETFNVVPWTVPTAVNAPEEGYCTAQLRAYSVQDLILDLEPYDHFWRGDEGNAHLFVREFRALSDTPVAVSIDYRRLPFPAPPFHELASRYLPQAYWTSFQRPWWQVLEEAAVALEPYGKPIEYVLPGDAERADLEDAIKWCEDHGSDVSIWVWHTIRPENWEVIAHYSTPPAPPGPSYEDLVNLLGYLQGDVAQTIENDIKTAQRFTTSEQARRWLSSALDAVTTLKTEGR